MSRPTDIRARDIESGSGGARHGFGCGLDRVLLEPVLFYGGGGMDSNGLWLRLYTDLYRNGKVRTLSESLQIRFVWILCLHKEGKLVGRSIEEIAWDLRIPNDDAGESIRSLISADLLMPDMTPVGWEDRQYQSDSSTERVRKHREKLRERSGNVTETVQSRVETETDAEESREGSPVPADDATDRPEAERLCRILRDGILDNRPSAKVPTPGDPGWTRWVADMDLMLRRDSRAEDEAAAVLRWTVRDDFWKSNILSPSKFRKQYDRLALQMRRPAAGGRKDHTEGNKAALSEALRIMRGEK